MENKDILIIIICLILMVGAITTLIVKRNNGDFETSDIKCQKLGYDDGIYHNELKGSPLECWNKKDNEMIRKTGEESK